VTLAEFQQQVFDVAIASSICDIPVIRRLTPTSINLRINMTAGGFIDAFHNERTGTTAYTLVQQGQRVFGADNTGGWHVHPFDDPGCHVLISAAMSFAEFVAEIQQRVAPSR